MKWTNEQQLAINTTDVNITVSASAGAGKTAVLVQRLMKRIIQDKISVDKIVALTFTEAAAAEMKNRLMRALSEAYNNNPNDTYLKTQITLLPSAKITTIHSFCLSILKDYYYVLQIDPSSLNNILDEAIIAKVKAEAFDYVLSNYNSEKLENTLYALSSSAMNIESLKDIVLELSGKSFSQPDPNKWLDMSIEIYNDYNSLKDLPDKFKKLFWTHNEIIKNQIKKSAYKLDAIIDGLNKTVDTTSQKAWISQVITYLQPLEESIHNQDYNIYKSTIESIASIKHKTIQKQSDFKNARDNYFKILNDAAEILYSEENLLKDLAHNKDLAQNIIEIVKVYNIQYKDSIKAENGITFNDMEILTYELLNKNNQEIAKELKNEIKDILVDEFQDTNTLQNEIIELIGRENNIFRVGDVKQSIYRFRGAKPNLMQDLIKKGNTDHHQTIFLSNNFRSKNDIVQYNNHLFSKLMNLETFDSSYAKSDYVTPGTDNQNINSLPAELHLINTEEEAYIEYDEDYNLSTNEFRAEYIANQILNLYEKDKNPQWNKFTILVSSHNSKPFLRQAFDQANIPYFIAMPDGFYNSFGVSTVNAYLKLILDPSDAISLTAILINLYGYNENEITKLFLIHGDLFKVADALDTNILKQINYLHENQNRLNLTTIINNILSINNFYDNKISQQSRTNLDLFYESAINYQKDQSGIYGFLLEIELMKEEKTSEASSISSEDNVVNVTTIHGSKGLQFDTVFLWSKSGNRNRDTSSSYVVNPDLGLALKTTYLPRRIIKDNLGNYLIRFLETKEGLEEEMRMLYVALTRAQNRLYVVDTFKLDKEKEYNDFEYTNIYGSIGFTGWINGIAQNHPSKHLIVNYQESFEYQTLDKKEKVVTPIRRFDKVDVKKLKETYSWPIKELDLDVEEKFFEVGTSIHDTIEKLPNSAWTPLMIKEVNPDISNYYLDKLLTLSQNPFFIDINKYNVYKEFPFISYIDNIYERGIIDYLVVSDDMVYIVDFKTDNVKNEKQLLERYNDQLTFYKNAISGQFKDKKIKPYIYSFYLDKFIEVK